MKSLKLSALLLGATLFLGLGATTLSAKCGGKMDMSKEKKEMKCGAGKCGGEKKAQMKKEAKKEMKCGTGKCGGEKKAAKKTMKCGAGKCGSK